MEKISYLTYGSRDQLSRVVEKEDGSRRYEAYFPKDGKFDWYEAESVRDAVVGDKWDWWPVSEKDVPALMQKEKDLRK